MTPQVIVGAFGDLALSGPITVQAESRIVRITRQRIEGDVVIERQASHVILSECYLTGGGVRIAGGAFHCSIDNCWIDHAPLHGVHVGDGAGIGGCVNSFRNVAVRWAASWGWLIQNQTAIAVHACSADGCGVGGLLASSAHGVYLSPSAESNPIGMRFYDCRGALFGENVIDNTQPLIIDGNSAFLGRSL